MTASGTSSSSSRSALPDQVATAAISLHASLPRHGKPVVRDSGVPEFTILSAIFLYTPTSLVPISLGTGVKVLPANRLPPFGDVVHDCHAEILARRGMLRWLIGEATRVSKGEAGEAGMEYKDGVFRLRDGVEVWMYISALPCGDASTLHTAAHQPVGMAALKSNIAQVASPSPGQVLRGRNGYENFGAIRTKPGRADSVPSICMSCSDKIATWSIFGLQGALLAEVFEPVCITHVVIGGVEENAPVGTGLEGGIGWRKRIKGELERALWGRLSSLEGHLPSSYSLHRPEIHLTPVDFPYSKSAISLNASQETVPSVLCVSHVPLLSEAPEIVFNGCRQGGAWKASNDMLLPDKARSRLCKFEIMKAYLDLRRTLHGMDEARCPLPSESLTYHDLKHPPASTYQIAKAILRGHPGPPAESLDFVGCGPFGTTAGDGDTPFRGWLVSGERYESFTVAGTRVAAIVNSPLEHG